MKIDIDSLVGKVIEFDNEEIIDAYDITFEIGMKARVIKIKDESDRPGNGECRIFCDFSEFEDFNVSKMTNVYYTDVPDKLVRWCDTPYYPKSKVEDIWVDSNKELPFKVVDEPSKGKGTYQITMELPEEGAIRLLTLWENKDPGLMKWCADNGIELIKKH